MFTGIIQAQGHILGIEARGGDSRLRVGTGKLPMTGVMLGDSIAVNGVCLTAVAFETSAFAADVSRETLARTTLGSLHVGSKVNLELALTPNTRMGGHIVSGHVDGVGQLISREDDGRSVKFRVKAPDALAKYIAEKGSICIDGISLTVNAVAGTVFDINIVPHTLAETTLGHATEGLRVNLEVDLLARYLERLLLGEQAAKTGEWGLTLDKLRASGFVD